MQAETTYQAIIGRILAQAREEIGRDQGWIAQEVGISRPTWSRIENGESALTMAQLVKTAEVLGKSPGAILNEADTVRKRLEAEGVKVHSDRVSVKAPSNLGLGLALLGSVALGALVSGILSEKSDSSPPKTDE